MELTEERQQQIDQIKQNMTCPFDFKCEKSTFKSYPKLRPMGELLECQEEDAEKCRHALAFGQVFICRCPLMEFIRISNSGTTF